VLIQLDVVFSGGHSAPQTVLVVMVGGVTYAEMTALRAAASQQELKVVVLTTDVITGDRVIQSFMPDSTKLATADAVETAAAL
jgi:hypothetical protein